MQHHQDIESGKNRFFKEFTSYRLQQTVQQKDVNEIPSSKL